jgi:uncharacterized protein YccT (UPF0319 family)
VRVYLVRDGKIGAATRTDSGGPAVAREAVEAVLAGPTEAETEAGLTTAIPGDVDLVELSVAGGQASVELSESFGSDDESILRLRTAQIVYTLTQFDTIDEVSIEWGTAPGAADGAGATTTTFPISRDELEDVTPAILLEVPTPGQTASSPIELTGSANTFEATFSVEVLDGDGKILVQKSVQATSGSGTRGTFESTVAVPDSATGPASVVVFAPSGEDGTTRRDEVEVPITLG